MHIKSIVAAAAIALIAGVGSVSADELTVDGTAVNTGTLFALPAGVATPMSEAELDAVRGQGAEYYNGLTYFRIYEAPSSSSRGEWELFFDGSAIGH